MRAWLSIVIVAGALTRASAQGANDEAIALALFNEGRALAEAGDLAHACPKFEAADRLTGWLGVELNLADCYARLGRTASAWVVFRKAAAKAEVTGDDRASYAVARAAALKPALARLTITAAITPVEVRIDDVVLTGAELGVAFPIDPGAHRVEARLPGEPEVWSRTVKVTPRASLTVAIPAPVHRPEAAVVARHAPRARRWLAWSLGGAGAVMLGTSLGLGVAAKLRYDAAVEDHCDANLVCGPAGVAGIASARRRANAATILGALGLPLAVAGILVHLGGREPARRVSIVPIATPETLGLSLGGTL